MTEPASPPLRLLIDTDPGVDDAIALMMALRHPRARVEALTVVAGNVGMEHTVRNARYVLELCDAGDVPVYAGAGGALLVEHRRAVDAHGDDGLGNLGLRPRSPDATPGHAVDALIARITAAPGQLTLVTLGPLTNIALALRREPAIGGMLRRVVMMGGAANAPGNVTPAAEFNVWADPEAARIVLRAGLPLTMVGIEIARANLLPAEKIAAIGALGTERARVAARLLTYSLRVAVRRGMPGAGCPDGTAMAVALDPATVTDAGQYHVDVETHGELTTGETVVDRRGVHGRLATTTVVHAIHRPRFVAMIEDAVRA